MILILILIVILFLLAVNCIDSEEVGFAVFRAALYGLLIGYCFIILFIFAQLGGLL